MNHHAAYTACLQLASRFYLSLDSADTPGLLACVTEATVWHRQGQALQGPHAIAQALAGRKAERITSHQISNFDLHAETDDEAVAHYYVTVYDNQGPDGTLQLKTILRSQDHFHRVNGQWSLLAKRSQKHL
ncbi:nuclear transport factor 2 family protein [Alcaligenes sp. SDU_A2]|uniref:nuclear transport factor 2 family protein n=1 Tax=Alcaligenes sp. SDU_A2 TaxID=3136634 RepID=UPI00311DAB6F